MVLQYILLFHMLAAVHQGCSPAVQTWAGLQPADYCFAAEFVLYVLPHALPSIPAPQHLHGSGPRLFQSGPSAGIHVLKSRRHSSSSWGRWHGAAMLQMPRWDTAARQAFSRSLQTEKAIVLPNTLLISFTPKKVWQVQISSEDQLVHSVQQDSAIASRLCKQQVTCLT